MEVSTIGELPRIFLVLGIEEDHRVLLDDVSPANVHAMIVDVSAKSRLVVDLVESPPKDEVSWVQRKTSFDFGMPHCAVAQRFVLLKSSP
jgi:hypothetical protein